MKKFVCALLLFCAFNIIALSQSKTNSTKTFEFLVEGMTCNGCANTVTETLLKVYGIDSATVDFETRKAKVFANDKVTKEQIKQVIASKNFEALFSGEDLVKPLTEEEKSKLDISVIKGGKKINIKEHLTTGKITIFDFYADWCGPCKLLTPKLERLLLKYSGLALRKVDVVNWKTALAKQLTMKYQLPGLPFTLIFDDEGKLLGQIHGNDIEKIEKIVSTNL